MGLMERKPHKHQSRQICRRLAATLLSFAAILPFAARSENSQLPTPNHQPSTLSSSTFQSFNFSTNSYTNHAGNVVSGVVVALDARTTTISNATETLKLPLSIFPEPEQRRIAADYVLGHPEMGTAALRVPAAVKRAIAGAEKAMARSRKRAEKELCSKKESDAFCEKSESALKSYLDKQVSAGTITPAERKALGR